MINNSQQGYYDKQLIKQFPIKTRIPIQRFLDWIVEFFKNNSHADSIPYIFYSHCCLVVHANIQKKELPCLI